MQAEIFRCHDEENGWWYLSSYEDEDEHEVLTSEALMQQTTLEQLADYCDQRAEGDNNHEFVGTHRILACLLHQQIGREQATRLLFEIASRGGLDGLTGIGGKQDSFAEFGITEPWEDWKLPD